MANTVRVLGKARLEVIKHDTAVTNEQGTMNRQPNGFNAVFVGPFQRAN
jgi:hypothetical protein